MNSIDWFKVIIDLNKMGLALVDIGHWTGIDSTTLGKYKTISAPRGKRAEKLIGFWSRKTGKPIADAPIRRWHESTK
jgi:hypothetical protein